MKQASGMGVRERILAAAGRLFRVQGFAATGVNQIIAESETAKASFYQYFPAKADLGRAFLESYGAEQLRVLGALMERYPAPATFVDAWRRTLERQARHGALYGCPLANFRAQIAESAPRLCGNLEALTARTLQELELYLTAAQQRGELSAAVKPKRAARRLFAAYQGVMQMYRLTGNVEALADLPALAASAWRADGAA